MSWIDNAAEQMCRCGHGLGVHENDRCSARRFVAATMISCDCSAGRREVEAGLDYLNPETYLELAKRRAQRFSATVIRVVPT